MQTTNPKRPRQEMLRSVALDRAARPAAALLGFDAHERAGVGVVSVRQRTGARGSVPFRSIFDPSIYRHVKRMGDGAWVWGPYARQYHHIVHQRYVNVPAWAAIGPPRSVNGRNRNAFRKGQAQMRTIALAQALQNSMDAVLAARGGGKK